MHFEACRQRGLKKGGDFSAGCIPKNKKALKSQRNQGFVCFWRKVCHSICFPAYSIAVFLSIYINDLVEG